MTGRPDRARTALAALLALVLVLGVFGCGRAAGRAAAPAPAAGDKLRVVASFFPLYDFARKIGGERVEVTNLLGAGVEPHDWEPRASDIKAINQAHVFLYNGAGFEPWVRRVLQGLDNRGLIAVDSSEGIELLDSDPHIWLDPVLNQHQVRRIVAALTRADPANRAAYEANAAALTAQLQRLDRDYQSLRSCKRRELIITHAFFAYPAKRYGLTQLPISGLAPDAEPTPQQLAALVRLARDRGVRYIFFETLVSDRVARVIAREVGAEVLVLNPIEGLTPDEAARGKDFLALMRENLANLRRGLECG